MTVARGDAGHAYIQVMHFCFQYTNVRKIAGLGDASSPAVGNICARVGSGGAVTGALVPTLSEKEREREPRSGP